MPISSKSRGSVSEYRAAAYFSEQGYEIFWSPSGAGPCDFVAIKGEESLRIQVKSAHCHKQGGSRYLRVNIRSGSGQYKHGDYDILAFVCKNRRVWVVPFDNLPKTSYLYVEKHNKKGDRKDYGLDQCRVI